jgi:hypothetical protein
MHYVTVFDAASDPLRHWWFPALGLSFALVGAAMIFIPRFQRFRGVGGRGIAGLGALLLLSSILWTSLASLGMISVNRTAQREVKSGVCTVVEGAVTDFHPMPEGGHPPENFRVNGVRFEYSDFMITGGFNNTASHGGPIRGGLPVRICYRDGEILRLEIAR